MTISTFPPENFFNPVLGQTRYTGTVDENSPPGTYVLTFTATDGDTMGPASMLTFYIEGANSGDFTVQNFDDNNTAILRTK